MICGSIGGNAERSAALEAARGAEYAVADATRAAELEAALGADLRGVVNCAGGLLLKPCHLASKAEWKQVMATNLTTAYATMRDGGGANGDREPRSDCRGRGEAMGLALSAAATYAPRGIRVNCVAPGLVETPPAARITGNQPAPQASATMHPPGRIATAEDVASGIVWSLDPENSWVTGQVLRIDGGLGTVRPR